MIGRAKNKRPSNLLGLLGCKSLTMSYFHTGTRTIIGAESFHCPVRDGKEWYQLAMVIRHNFCVALTKGQHNEFIEFGISLHSACAVFISFLNASLGITP